MTLRTTRSEIGAAEALAQSQVDLAATSLEALLRFGIRDGQNPRLLFGLTAAPPVALVVDAAHGRLRTVADLVGQRVALSAPGAAEHTWLTLLLARARLTPAQIQLTSVGAHGLDRALMTGEVRAALVPEPVASRVLGERRATLLADLRTPVATQKALGVPTVSAAIFVRAERRPGERELAAFTRGLLAAEERLGAEAKARAVAASVPKAVILAADTMVVIDGEALGKPEDTADAMAMLRRLRGREHEVMTGVAVIDHRGTRAWTDTAVSRVVMARYSDAVIERYAASGAPLDKAGGYAIQDLDGTLVDAVIGSYTNVIGLPLGLTGRLLASEGKGAVTAYFKNTAENGSKQELKLSFSVEGKVTVK